jgi:hypothetical protein
MPDEAQSSAASTASEELAVLNGGVEIDVEKIDGSLETVTVRQLPISLVGQWRRFAGRRGVHRRTALRSLR